MDNLLNEIEKTNKVYESYLRKYEEIDLFVQTAEQQKEFVNKAIVSQDQQDFINGLERLSNSVVLYNAAIISIYGSYELFVDEIIKSYIGYLKHRYESFELFPDPLKEKHKRKSAEFLSNPDRFANIGISDEGVIRALEASHLRDESSALIEDLMLAHSGNLKTKQLQELMKDVGFVNPIHRLIKHYKLNEIEKQINQKVTNKDNDSFLLLDQIVEERNKIGHGWIVENRLAFSLLHDSYFPFIKWLCEAIKDMIVSQIIEDYMGDNIIEPFGNIIHIWGNGTLVGINSSNFRLRVNDYLYLSTGDEWKYPFRIVNLQRNNKDISEVRSNNKDVCIKTDIIIRKKNTIWGYRK